MREKYMLALANLVNGSELGYKDRSSIPQYKKDIEDYVESLEKENQKYKEVIDKAIKELNNYLNINTVIRDELLEILKEVK